MNVVKNVLALLMFMAAVAIGLITAIAVFQLMAGVLR